jgi:hypothetical protein
LAIRTISEGEWRKNKNKVLPKAAAIAKPPVIAEARIAGILVKNYKMMLG